MTAQEFLRSPEFREMMDKIRSYKPGFTFTVRYIDIPHAEANGLKIVLKMACEKGLLKSIEKGYGMNEKWQIELFEETFERTEVE